MANLKGEGALKGVNLVARTYDNNVTKSGTHQFLDIQVDVRDPRGADQANLHLVSKRTEQGYNNSAAYATSQYEAMQKIAGPNTEAILDDKGEAIGKVMCFKADLMKNPSGPGFLANTQTLDQSEFRVDAQTIDRQFAAMGEVKAARAEAKAAEPAPEVQEQVEAPAPQVEEPALG